MKLKLAIYSCKSRENTVGMWNNQFEYIWENANARAFSNIWPIHWQFCYYVFNYKPFSFKFLYEPQCLDGMFNVDTASYFRWFMACVIMMQGSSRICTRLIASSFSSCASISEHKTFVRYPPISGHLSYADDMRCSSTSRIITIIHLQRWRVMSS